ncbi:protein sbm, partial [Neorhizobium sp. DT-125]
QDYDYLMSHGVAAVFGPGTNVLDAANKVLDLIEGKRRNI